MPTIQNEATRPPFFVSGKYLRGDALLTMLNSKTPIPEIYETAQSMHGSDENGYLKDDSGKIIAFDDGIDWKFFGTKDPQPTGARVTNYSYSRDQDRYENHPGIRAGSYTTPDFYETVTNDEDLPGGIKQYRPAHGDYVVTTYTTLSGSRETEVFTDVTSTMQITQNDEAGIIWEDLVITTTLRIPGIDTVSKSRTLKAAAKKRISINEQIPEGKAIQSWQSKAGEAKLYWKQAETSDTVDLCLEMTIENTHRTHCTLWDIQSNWSYGNRFRKGGTYIVSPEQPRIRTSACC